MLNEFCLNTRYNRKYAIRLLNGPPPGKQAEPRPRGRRPRYGRQVLSILTAIWEAAGYPWSVRLKALLPSWMPWIRKRYRLSPEISAHIEQENWTHVRKLMGWERYDTKNAVAAMND